MAIRLRDVCRHALVAAVCLLLGVLTTVGTAWGLCSAAAWERERVNCLSDGARWPRGAPSDWPDPIWVRRRSGLGWENVLQLAVDFDVDPNSPGPYTIEMRAGLPMPALDSVSGLPDPISALFFPWTEGWNIVSIREGFVFDDRYGIHRRLPIRPLFPGFMVNTILFAGAWWLILFGPITACRWQRARARRRAGHCLACGYDLAGVKNPRCPECGARGPESPA